MFDARGGLAPAWRVARTGCKSLPPIGGVRDMAANASLMEGTMTDFTPRRDVYAISHINVVVDDIDVATEFYGTVLGFEQAVNADGPMDYPSVDLTSFARNAGFDDERVSLDIRF
jgi:hypothetical protein